MSTTYRRISDDLEHTRTIARDFAAVLRGGDLVTLTGEMGAGKTTFTRMLCEELGVDASLVSSPTFVIMNLYPIDDSRSVAHLDCYRMGDESELEAIGWDQVTRDGAIRLVEWPDRISEALDQEDHCSIVIEHAGESSRVMTIEIPGSWGDRATIGTLTARKETVCPVTGEVVHPECGSWPFSSERARMSDLHGWMNESYSITRPIEQADIDQE